MMYVVNYIKSVYENDTNIISKLVVKVANAMVLLL